MRVGIIGAGAMGGLYGGQLALSGVDVCLIEKDPAAVTNIKTNGFQLSGIGGEHTMALEIESEAANLAPVDIAFIHTDTNNTASAAQHAGQILKPEGFAITFQNGIGNVEILQSELGAERVMGGISYHSARLQSPGHSVHTNANKTWIGELDGERSARAEHLATLLNDAGFAVELVEDIDAVIWTKFVLNCAVNPICAITGFRTGEIGQDVSGRHFQMLIVDEILTLIAARNITLQDPDIRTTINNFSGKLFNKPSMLQHMEKGLVTEIESLNGAAVRAAQELGLDMPYNNALTLLIKACSTRTIRALHGPAIDYDALEAKAS